MSGQGGTTSDAKPQGADAQGEGWRTLFERYRIELLLFALSFALLAAFSSHRFLRQSAAPHFIYQAKAWLEGRIDVDPEVLPNLEDWACVRQVGSAKVRCEGRLLPTDRWYVSFPSFPALLMLPFVAVNGYQLNDTSFGVCLGALAIAAFYSLLRKLSERGESTRTTAENAVLALSLGFGTVFFYCAIRGEVWFLAEVLGVLLTCLYARNAVRAERPVWAGLFFSMAVLTRTPLLFSGLFFVLEAVSPEAGSRLEQWKKALAQPQPALRKLGLFAAGAAPIAVAGAAYNYLRFGSVAEFGHRFFYNNRVNVDIDRFGLFHPAYLARNLEAAFLKLPQVGWNPLRLGYEPHGLTLLLTLPLLLLVFVPPRRKHGVWPLALFVPLGLFLLRPDWLYPSGVWVPGGAPLAPSAPMAWLLLASLVALAFYGQPESPQRLHWPLWATVGACALPGLLYQNTGYTQFGFRFSLDYTPYLVLLFALSGWSLKQRWVQAALALGVAVAFWGAVGFAGYTEYVRRW